MELDKEINSFLQEPRRVDITLPQPNVDSNKVFCFKVEEILTTFLNIKDLDVYGSSRDIYIYTKFWFWPFNHTKRIIHLDKSHTYVDEGDYTKKISILKVKIRREYVVCECVATRLCEKLGELFEVDKVELIYDDMKPRHFYG